MNPTLVILAAGMGSRYGGLKQLDPVGPAGEVVMDYSVFDAKRAGFDRVVFVIRPDIEAAFHEAIGRKIGRYIDVDYVFQTLDMLPVGFTVPENRSKPWGTAHAVLTAKDKVNAPFAVINADDFYGETSFGVLADNLQTKDNNTSDYCMVGFELERTLSKFGTVSRGICTLDEERFLTQVQEFTALGYEDGRIIDNAGAQPVAFGGKEMVSMNMWGFTPSFFTALEESFCLFLKEAMDDPRAEFYIPTAIDRLTKTGLARVKVLQTPDQWFGVTYGEDKPFVVDAVQKLIDEGQYPKMLWR